MRIILIWGVNANENHSHLAGIKKARPREGAGKPERNAVRGSDLGYQIGGSELGLRFPVESRGIKSANIRVGDFA